MTRKKARLGRGLGALLGDVKTTTQANDSAAPAGAESPPDSAKPSGFREVPVELLHRGPYQPRLSMDKEALAQLGESIRSQGVLQPLLVRPKPKGQFEIIAGERRWRGAQIAGLTTVPVVVRDIPDQTAMAVGLIENIQRENLNAIEEAKGYQRLLDEFGLTHQEVSEAVGCSRATVSNLIRLLALHPAVQKMVEQGKIEMGHARALLGLPEQSQPEAAATVYKKGLSVRQAEHLVKTLTRSSGAGKAAQKSRKGRANADIRHLEEDLSTRLGAKVTIQHGANKGKLVIHYHSLDELDGILDRIK